MHTLVIEIIMNLFISKINNILNRFPNEKIYHRRRWVLLTYFLISHENSNRVMISSSKLVVKYSKYIW